MASPTHTYAQSGSYNVSVRLTDSSGHTETATSLVNVQGNSCLFGEVVPSWSESETYSPGDKVSYRSSIYEATWWSVGARPDIYSNVWKNLGSDNGGGDDCKDNTAPVAKFTVTTNKLTATFTDQSTDDKGVVSRQWDFGDGTVSSVASPTHQYTEDGDYTVTLSVTDKEGLNSEISKTISVKGDTDNGSCSVEAWSSSKVYNSGDEVSHKGNRYRAKWWTQGEDPSSTGQWGVWENLGACQVAK
ncbi:hypothetical protein CS022_09895 [Veronia nyctiphanis]|uniref:PKD domain-containing protein n=1 Tax=Veronia nyctiphanis TaxID=1278244 RepID=A0A4Q0YWB0_9GAMM|nr:PKD domain-containing protein [Veronia nyctiphanis]RXJ73301.1 hypothetical protein CS022_09895 [Veronia nyctiphanis]